MIPTPSPSQKTTVVRVPQLGIPSEVVTLGEEALPSTGPGQALVRMKFAPIHPADLNMIEGTYGIRRAPPFVPGNEGAGEVIEIGPGVTALRIGQLVKPPSETGCWREALVTETARLTPLPDGLSAEQAAMISVNPPTAWRMLEDFVRLEPGDWVIQNAANSAVGRCVIQIARHRGFKTINLVRRAELADELKALGADAVLLETENNARAIKDLTAGCEIRLGLNAVGGESSAQIARALGHGGVVVTYGGMSKKPLQIPTGLLIFKNIQARGFWMTTWFRQASPEAVRAMLEPLADMMRRGQLIMPVTATYPLTQATEALRHAMSSQRAGKVLFRMN